MKAQHAPLRPRRGRPRKFAGPSRAVTLTLPESTIAMLTSVDHDLSRAIVRLTEERSPKRAHKAAELATFGRHAVIIVRPTPTLKQRTGVDLVPLPDERALISFERPTTIEGLELTLADAVDDPRLAPQDRAVFEAIRQILRTARQSTDVAMLQKSIIVLQTRRPQPETPRRTLRPSKTDTA
jgi:hypothetical protein